MKKGGIFFLIGLTLMFVGFIAGMLVGRHTLRDPVTIQFPPETTKQSVPAAPDEPESVQNTDTRININTAHLALLDTLPGIGPVLAQRIIDYREANGPFRSVAELGMVEGIGSERLMTIYDLIKVED